MSAIVRPTPFAEVNDAIALLLGEVRALLGVEFVGLYLYGSLSLGDFTPGSSDVDFLVVTRDMLSAVTQEALAALHARLAMSDLPYARKLEGWYFPRVVLRRDNPGVRVPTIGADWPFGLGEPGPVWVIERWIVRERGVTVAGPSPDTLIDPVAPEALRAAVRALLRDFWAQQLDGPDWLRTRDYQAFAILTMCRALHTLATGTVVSKPAAAAWASTHLDPRWISLIERALVWRHDTGPDDMTEMLAFVRWTVDRAALNDGAAASQEP
jgi:predicted nucleotidyltransferase